MIEHGSFFDRQSEAHPARLSRAKRREDFLFDVSGDAMAIVANGDDDCGRLLALAERFRRQADLRFVSIGNPRPIPRGLVVQNGEKIFSLMSAAMPWPLSRTVTMTAADCLPSRSDFAAKLICGLFRSALASAAFATKCANASASADSSPSTRGKSLGKDVSISTFPLIPNRERTISSAFLTGARTSMGFKINSGGCAKLLIWVMILSSRSISWTTIWLNSFRDRKSTRLNSSHIPL